jgi:tetratricopeptide (TPR) repeat protein
MKALEIMEEHFSEKEMIGYKAKFMALTYTRLTNIFSDQYLHEQTIYFGKHALPYYNSYNAESWHIAWMMDEIGVHYDMMEQYDSAEFYYNKAIEALPDTNNLTYRDIATARTFLSYNKEKKTPSALKQMNHLLAQAESEEEYLARCLIIGDIFYHEKIYDSAWIYLDSVFKNSSNIACKKQSAVWLAEICEILGKDSEISVYSNPLVMFATADENNGMTKSKLTELHRNFEQKQLETTHRQKTRKNLWMGIFLLGFLFVLFLILAVLLSLNKKQLKAKEIHFSAVLGKAKKTIERLQEEKKVLIEVEKASKAKTEQPKIREEEYSALMKEGICINIKQRLKKADELSSFNVKDYDLALSHKDICNLFLTIDKHCPDFAKRLLDKYPTLKANEIKLCRFYLMDLTIKQVAILLDTDYSSIRKRTHRIKEKIGCEELAQQLRLILFEVN